MSQHDVHDSPVAAIAQHARLYVESGGEQGHHWNGMTTLLLTTTGRQSGSKRRTPLIYGVDGEAYVIVASRGGEPTHPAWYLNLVADPDVELQVGADVFPARARVAHGQERERLWRLMAGIFPTYDDYATKTERELPVVVLDRA